MPASGPGGTQSSLAGMVAWLTKPFRGKPGQNNGAVGKDQTRDVTQFQEQATQMLAIATIIPTSGADPLRKTGDYPAPVVILTRIAFKV